MTFIPTHLLSRIVISDDSVTNLLKKTEFIISSGPTSIIFESLLYSCKLLYLNLDPYDYFIYKKQLIKKIILNLKNKITLLKYMNKFNSSTIPKLSRYRNNSLYSKLSNENIKLFY